mmetsp:Transcript_17039/g.50866  ORF Transcript_17039/g.50866 Transcript_17039/m.50866 type:complete len:284 (+) Transcript_17039:393-1244(+)
MYVLVSLLGQDTGGVLGVPEQHRHLLQVGAAHVIAAIRVRQSRRRRQQLHGVAEAGALADVPQQSQTLLINVDALNLCSDGQNLNGLRFGVRQCANDEQPVQQICRHAMRTHHICPSHLGYTAVGGKNNDGGKCGLQGAVQIGEALQIQHMHLVNKQDSRNKLCCSLIDVFVDHLVDFLAQLIGDLGLLGFHHLPHDRHDVLPSRWLGICCVQVVKCHVLHDGFLLMHIALGEGHILLHFKVELRRVCVAPPHPLHRSAVRLDVDDVTREDFLLLQRIVDERV